MKKIFILLFTAIAGNQFLSAQVAINNDGTTPNSSAMLDIKSTSRGLLTPRMTTAQRNAIASPATGLMVYDTDLNKFFYYGLISWIELSTGSATNYWTQSGTDIYNSNTGNVGIGVSSPLGTLDVMRGTASGGTAWFRGTTHVSHFNFGTNEDTYIRGGKNFSHVLINDNSGLGNVGIGTDPPPPFKLTVKTSSPSHGIAHTDGTTTITSYIDASGGWLGTYSNHPLHFFTNNGLQQMTLLQNGNVGIGTTNPLAKLHINQNDEALRFSGVSPYISFYEGNTRRSYIWNDGGSVEINTDGSNANGELRLKTKGVQGLTVQSDGRVRVGALPCVQPMSSFGFSELPKFSVQGALGLRKNYGDEIAEWALYPASQDLDIYYNGGLKAHVEGSDGDWIGESDIRLKENFENYKSVLDRIKKLDVLTYHYKADKTGKRSFGLVAQNVQQYFPEIVSSRGGEDNLLGISYGKTGVLAIKAIQEQQVIIETLEKKIEILEKRMMILEQRIKN